jgi:ParB family transcriptional regulator, chromosome partitioning protein
MQEIHHVSLNSIEVNPWQPRREFSDVELQGLASSIKTHGILQPLVVTEQTGGGYRLIAGERRFRASKLAGLSRVPVIIRQASNEEQLELALIENIQRQDLNAIERAKAYKRLMDEFKLNQIQVAERMGKARSAIANTMRLLDLPEEIQAAVASNRITEGHAKVIAGLPTAQQKKFFDKVVQHGLSVRETEHMAKEQKKRQRQASYAQRGDQEEDLGRHYRNLLESHLGTKVEVTGDEAGTVAVHFYSEEELIRVVKKMLGKEE